MVSGDYRGRCRRTAIRHALPLAAISAGIVVFVLYRYGLLAVIGAIYFLHLMIFFPITSDFSAWYAADFVLTVMMDWGW